MIVEYRRAYQERLELLRGSLEEQAHAVRLAYSQIKGKEEFARYVDEFCAQINGYISPGHHILVLNDQGQIIASTRHHSGKEMEETLLTSDPTEKILYQGKHRLAQVRLQDEGKVTFVLAQYLDHMEGVLRKQLISRFITVGVTAGAIILLLYILINLWVLKPVDNLSTAAKDWADRNFAARSDLTGAADFQLLAKEFNGMAAQLERHEQDQTRELDLARQIQINLLPSASPKIQGLNITADYRPTEHVAGDLYDIIDLSGNKTAIVILDVCGHGISAALLTGVVKMSLHRRLAENEDLSRAMKLVNEDLLACTTPGQFVTACVGMWNSQDRTWTYCAAGHPGGVLFRQGQTQLFSATASLLGVLTDTDWPINEIHLKPQDRVLLYTDGVTEIGVKNDELMTRIQDSIFDNGIGLDLGGHVAAVMANALPNTTSNIKDDATIVAFEVQEKPSLYKPLKEP